MVALEALACGTPVLASDHFILYLMVYLGQKMKRQKVGLNQSTICLGQRSNLTDELNQHSIESINSNLLTLYEGLIQSAVTNFFRSSSSL